MPIGDAREMTMEKRAGDMKKVLGFLRQRQPTHRLSLL